jgi:hypothetical protein
MSALSDDQNPLQIQTSRHGPAQPNTAGRQPALLSAPPASQSADADASAPPPAARARGPRRRRAAAIATAILLFLGVSALLARFLSTENAERSAESALLGAQVRGDANGMLARLHGCRERAACVATVRANAVGLRRTGAVKILSLKSATAYSLSGATGTTRVAWTVIGRLPVVQCVKVRRTGSFLSGIRVTLLSISAPIAGEADC